MNKVIIVLIVVLVIITILIIITLAVKYSVSTDNKLHFVHISKNGGTSIGEIGKNICIYNHDINANMIKSDIIYAIIRDPVSRFTSSFYFAKKGGFAPDNSTFKNHPIHNFKDVNSFLSSLKNHDPIAIKALNASQEGLDGNDANVIYWTQLYWLYSKNNKKLVLLDFTNLNENFKKLTRINLNITNTTNKKEDIGKDNIQFLEKLYSADFKLYQLVKKYQIYYTDTDAVKNLGKCDVLVTPIRFQNLLQ